MYSRAVDGTTSLQTCLKQRDKLTDLVEEAVYKEFESISERGGVSTVIFEKQYYEKLSAV